MPDSRGQVLRLADELILSKEERKALLQVRGFSIERWPTEVFVVPQQRDMFFTGRDDVLESLRRLLVPESTAALTQALSGLGGIGKTHTALEYAYRYGKYYEDVLWLQADSLLAMASACVDLAYELGLPELDEQDQTKIVEAIKRWLRTHRHWLLILDNVEDLQLIAQIVPTNHQGCVLVTTRLPNAEPLARTQILPLIPEHEGILFLLKRTKRLRCEDDNLKHASNEAREIWQDMDGLPLALDQAGAYILETGCSFATYREQFAKQRAELLARRGKRYIGHEASVAATFSLLFGRVKAESSLAADILSTCSLLHSEAVPDEVFLTPTQQLSPLLTPSREGWYEAVSLLLDYSLVKRNIDARTLSMHRLVQVVLLDLILAQERVQRIGRIITAMHQIFPSIAGEAQLANADTSWFPLAERLLPHVLTSIKHLSSWTAVSRDLTFPLANLLYKVACYLNKRPRPTEAISLYEQVLPGIQTTWRC